MKILVLAILMLWPIGARATSSEGIESCDTIRGEIVCGSEDELAQVRRAYNAGDAGPDMPSGSFVDRGTGYCYGASGGCSTPIPATLYVNGVTESPQINVRCGGPDIGDRCVACTADGHCDMRNATNGMGTSGTLYVNSTVHLSCDPGWTLVEVGTSLGTTQKCAAVGDLRDPK